MVDILELAKRRAYYAFTPFSLSESVELLFHLFTISSAQQWLGFL
jgi:hypothetical protein